MLLYAFLFCRVYYQPSLPVFFEGQYRDAAFCGHLIWVYAVCKSSLSESICLNALTLFPKVRTLNCWPPLPLRVNSGPNLYCYYYHKMFGPVCRARSCFLSHMGKVSLKKCNSAAGEVTKSDMHPYRKGNK